MKRLADEKKRRKESSLALLPTDSTCMKQPFTFDLKSITFFTDSSAIRSMHPFTVITRLLANFPFTQHP